MKNLLSIVLLMVATVASAQSQSIITSFLNRQYQAYRSKPTPIKSAQKPTNTYWRISATANYSFSGPSLNLTDSASYRYSNGRGSSLNLNGEDLEIYDYGFESTIQSDTTNNYTDNGNGIELYERYINSYDSKNLRSEIVGQAILMGTLQDNSKEVVVRDANDRIVNRYSLFKSGSKWDTSRVDNVTYNANGKAVLDSSYTTTGAINPFRKTSYSYDVNGNLIESLALSWDIAGKKWDTLGNQLITHISNQISVTIFRFHNGTQMANEYRDSVVNDNNGNYIYRMTQEWKTPSNQWVNSSLETRTIANNQPVVAEFSEWDDGLKIWEKEADADFIYNVNGDLENVILYGYANGTKLTIPDAVFRVYYEHYFNVDIDDVVKNNQLQVYPNPVTDVLNIRVKHSEIAQIRLTNMTGQTVYSAELKGEQMTVPVSGLAAGNYILSVGDARQLVTVQ